MVASEAPGFVQLGHYPAPRHTLVHVSDTHFLAGHAPLYGAVDTDLALGRAFEQLERSGVRPSGIVITGDLADLAEPDAYRRLRALIEPAAKRLGAEIIWVMGNHDEQASADTDLVGFNPQAAMAIEWTREHLTEEQRAKEAEEEKRFAHHASAVRKHVRSRKSMLLVERCRKSRRGADAPREAGGQK